MGHVVWDYLDLEQIACVDRSTPRKYYDCLSLLYGINIYQRRSKISKEGNQFTIHRSMSPKKKKKGEKNLSILSFRSYHNKVLHINFPKCYL